MTAHEIKDFILKTYNLDVTVFISDHVEIYPFEMPSEPIIMKEFNDDEFKKALMEKGIWYPAPFERDIFKVIRFLYKREGWSILLLRTLFGNYYSAKWLYFTSRPQSHFSICASLSRAYKRKRESRKSFCKRYKIELEKAVEDACSFIKKNGFNAFLDLKIDLSQLPKFTLYWRVLLLLQRVAQTWTLASGFQHEDAVKILGGGEVFFEEVKKQSEEFDRKVQHTILQHSAIINGREALSKAAMP